MYFQSQVKFKNLKKINLIPNICNAGLLATFISISKPRGYT